MRNVHHPRTIGQPTLHTSVELSSATENIPRDGTTQKDRDAGKSLSSVSSVPLYTDREIADNPRARNDSEILCDCNWRLVGAT